MRLTKHATSVGERWALDGRYLSADFRLTDLLKLSQDEIFAQLAGAVIGDSADSPLLPPIEATQEVWACGVTYLRSRDARQAESNVADVYERVYDADRPEVFFKSLGWRVRGHGQTVRIRADSSWDVPEPELTLVVNAHQEIIGYCVGNDMSSRSIEGENPLYLPQAKTYRGACALGPALVLGRELMLRTLPIGLTIIRQGDVVFNGATHVNKMKRESAELVTWLCRELDFPEGVFLMTGTGLVPDDSFTLQSGDHITITIGDLRLENMVSPPAMHTHLPSR